LMRREGLFSDPVLPVWSLRAVLLNADQLCLSRMQIHVILSIVHPSEHGEVDAEYFLRVVCTVIPYMFDAATFMEKASTIAKEKADALAKAEMEELQGLTSSLTTTKNRRETEDEGDDVQANAPDRDAVEKALIHNASQYDEKHRQQPTLNIRKFMEAMHHETVLQCQLSEAELRGFIAEADIDEREEIGYVEHIKMWVPVIFELRKSRVYDSILSKDWGVEATNLIDLSSYEERFPLLIAEDDDELPGARAPKAKPVRPSSAAHDRDRRPSSRTSGRGDVEHTEAPRKPTKDRKKTSKTAQSKASAGGARNLNRGDSNESITSRTSHVSDASRHSRR